MDERVLIWAHAAPRALSIGSAGAAQLSVGVMGRAENGTGHCAGMRHPPTKPARKPLSSLGNKMCFANEPADMSIQETNIGGLVTRLSKRLDMISLTLNILEQRLSNITTGFASK